jgi:hypothetical protein
LNGVFWEGGNFRFFKIFPGIISPKGVVWPPSWTLVSVDMSK